MSTSLIERRNAAASELARLVELEEQLVTRDGFDPDAQQYTDLVTERGNAEANVTRLDALLDSAGRAEPRADRERPGMDWATALIREKKAGKPTRIAEVPALERAYHVVASTEPYLKAQTTTIRPTPPDWALTMPVVDAATTVSVSGNSYRYVTLPPLPTPGVVIEGGPKPAVEFTSSEQSGQLAKSAYILDVTSETLEDEPQARTILSDWLIQGVQKKIETDAEFVVTGGSGYLTAATPAGGNAAQGIRLGVATLQAQGLKANAALINPADWANLDYVLLGMAGSNSQTVVQSAPWGVELIACAGVPAGTVFVGDLKAGILHIQRTTVSVDITDSGMSVESTPRDRFTHNLYGFRAEARYKTIVQQPKAIVKVTLTP